MNNEFLEKIESYGLSVLHHIVDGEERIELVGKNESTFISVVISSYFTAKLVTVYYTLIDPRSKSYSYHFDELSAFIQEEKIENSKEKEISVLLIKEIEKHILKENVGVILIEPSKEVDYFDSLSYKYIGDLNLIKEYPFMKSFESGHYAKVVDETILKMTENYITEFDKAVETIKVKEPTIRFIKPDDTDIKIFYYQEEYWNCAISYENSNWYIVSDEKKFLANKPLDALEKLLKKIEQKSRLKFLFEPSTYYLQKYTELNQKRAKELHEQIAPYFSSSKEIENAAARAIDKDEKFRVQKFNINDVYLLSKLDNIYILLKEEKCILCGTKDEVNKKMQAILEKELENTFNSFEKG